MDLSIGIGVIVVAGVAYFLWNRNKEPGQAGGGSMAAAPAAPAAPTPAANVAGAPLASYDEYRRHSPSNMVYGKLTCNRCGSNLIHTAGGTATCTSCGAALYRA